MMINKKAFACALLCLSSAAIAAPGDCLSADEAHLLDLINEYRGENGLPPVPRTVSLSAVGQWHAWDYPANAPWPPECNLHSWSDAMPALWTGMCYTSDHAQAALMWSKPEEISGGIYTGFGFEIAAFGYPTPEGALDGWKNSSGHNDVILNQGTWATYSPWPAMGVGIDPVNKYYFVWFGSSPDPQGAIETCAVATPPGRIDADAAPLTIGRSLALPGGLDLSWGASTCSPGPSDYTVHAGTLGDFTSHNAILCDTGGTLFDATISPGPGSEYYLVVPITDTIEGSYGEDSAGTERLPSASSCHAAQDVTSCP